MTNIRTREAQQKPPAKQINLTAKVLLDIGTRKLSGRLTIREPNADPIYWRIYFGNGQVHFATSATGQRERLSYFLQRYFPELTPSKRDDFHSDYQYLCRYWKSGQLSLQQIRKLLFALSQEAMVQLLALPQATLQFEKTVGLDPLVLSVPLKQIVAPLQVNTRQWTQLRPEIGSPFQRPFVANPGQFAQLLRPKVRENTWFQSLSAALTQNHCLYEVAGQVKLDALQLAILLQPLVRAGAVGIHPFTLPQADERRIIACIDDSKTVQRNVKLTLEAAGYRVLGLMEPARALTMLVRHKPALVLMDISMPEIDGYELCRMLRQSTFLKDIPIVMLTGRDGFIDRLRARVVGANDYMTKPFAPKHLLATVRNRLSLTGNGVNENGFGS